VTGTIKGKIAYMPPEQILATGVDQRSDIFSAGVVLWELLTGRRLFGRGTDAATLYAIMNDPIVPPSRYRPEVPRELDAIVMRALSRTPADRYDSAEEMSTALEAVLAHLPKCVARVLAAMVEELFGASRAEAKRAISQTRSLGHNISLVMKLRTEVRAELAANLETLASGSSTTSPVPVATPRRYIGIVLGAAVLLGTTGGVVYAVADAGPKAPTVAATTGALLVESDPPGAAISINDEPSGLKTPARLTALAGKQVKIRLDLAGYGAVAYSIDVPTTTTLAKRVALTPATGRLVLADLPRGASVVVDGTEYQAGEVVDVAQGKHAVQVIVGDKTIVQQQVDATSGDQIWRLAGDRLVAD
jgi:hypothetical protein